MPYDVTAGPVLAAVSGLGLIVLGSLVLRLERRNRSSLAFSLFALLWGIQLVAANLYRMSANASTAEPWAWLFAAGLILLYGPLLYFVSAFPWPSNWITASHAGPLVLATPAGFLLVLLGTSPELFFQPVTPPGSEVSLLATQDLFVVLSGLVSIGAFVAALLVGFRKLKAATETEERSRLALVVAALGFYVGNRASLVLDWGVLNAGALYDDVGAIPYAVLLGSAISALAAIAYVGVEVFRARDLAWRDLILAATSLPLAAGLLGALLRDAGATDFELVGLWRLAMVGLFAYAISRYELFDLELRLRDAAPAAGYLATLAIGLGILWGEFGDLFSDPAWLGASASLGVAACCWPAWNLTAELFDRAAGHVGQPEYLYKRKVEVYRSALEEAKARGMGSETEQQFLSDLRRNLGISEEEHQILLMVLEGERRFGQASARDPEDKFEILDELGRGSFGRARLARDTTLDREVVLKEPTGPWLFEEDGRELFLREAKIAAQLNHPNVVQVYEVLPDRDPPVLVLEYVAGGALDDLLAEQGPLPVERSLEIFEDVLEGLDCIHTAGIVHRDLKPANILLDHGGEAKITDFGIAHPPQESQLKVTLATGDTHPGTVAYMSPEQVRGAELDKRSDVYAAGAILYEMLSGRHYLGSLEDVSETQIRHRIREERPDLGHDRLPKVFEPVIARALAKDPDERFDSAQALQEAIQGIAVAPPGN